MRENPRSEQAHNYYGFALGRTGHLEEAIEELHKALQLNPRYPDALYNLGAALGLKGDHSGAEKALKAAWMPRLI